MHFRRVAKIGHKICCHCVLTLALALYASVLLCGCACSQSKTTIVSNYEESATNTIHTQTSKLILLSSPDGGKTGGERDGSRHPQLNNQGQIVFVSFSTNLPGSLGMNNESQVYQWDLAGGLKLVSSPDGINGAASPAVTHSSSAKINDAGQVVFRSNGLNLPGGSTSYQIYLWDSINGAKLVSSMDGIIGGTGVPARRPSDVGSSAPIINESGQIVFQSNASEFPGSYGDATDQLYFWEPEIGFRLATTPDGFNGAKYAGDGYFTQYNHDINDAGQIVFESRAENLPGANGFTQVYLWDPVNGIQLISSNDGTAAGTGDSKYAKINNSGKIVFQSKATNLPGGNGLNQVYLWDAENGVTLVSDNICISDGLNDKKAKLLNSCNPLINDANQVVFRSGHKDPLDSSADFEYQVYLWVVEEGVTLISSPDGTSRADRSTFACDLNNLGQVVFESDASNLPGATGQTQVYLWDHKGGLTLVSSTDGVQGSAADSNSSQINDLGQVVFASNASNLPGANGASQIYLWEKTAQ